MNTNVAAHGAGAVLIVGLLSMTPSAVFAATPTLIVSGGGTTPYSTITLSGTGFAANENVSLLFGLSTTSAHTSSAGSFTGAALTIPNIPTGLYTIIGIGQTLGDVGSLAYYVAAFNPNISPSTWWTAPGSTVSFSGSGFAPNEQVTSSLGGSASPYATFAADASGAFTDRASFTIPYSLRNASAVFALHGLLSGYTQTINVGVGDLYPYINSSLWYVLPGNTIVFSGGGFGAGEGVSVYYGTSSTVIAHTTANSIGAFAATPPIFVPYGTGVAPFRVVGDLSGATVAAPITRANFYPTLNPSAYYSAPGGTISLSGSGFAPNEVVDVTMGSATTTTTATTDASGAFSIVALHLPAVGGVQIAINAVGRTSGATSNFLMTMGQYYSWIVVNNWYALGGTPLTITGHNFAAGESIALSSGGLNFGSAIAGSTGDFVANTTVPYAPAGNLTLVATGNLSNASANLTMTVAPVYTDIQLAHYFGAPGTAIEFIGHGYVPNDIVQIRTNRTGTTVVATIHADATGSFDNTSYVIPSTWLEGNLLLTITGTRSFDVKTIGYYVTGI